VVGEKKASFQKKSLEGASGHLQFWLAVLALAGNWLTVILSLNHPGRISLVDKRAVAKEVKSCIQIQRLSGFHG
jgi:hypothetical protein